MNIKSLTDLQKISYSLKSYENEFEQLGKLGKGGFSSVYKVRNKLDNNYYAVKKIELQVKNIKKNFQQEINRVLREAQSLAQISHPNIIRYYHSWIELQMKSHKKSLEISNEIYKKSQIGNQLRNGSLDSIFGFESQEFYEDQNVVALQEETYGNISVLEFQEDQKPQENQSKKRQNSNSSSQIAELQKSNYLILNHLEKNQRKKHQEDQEENCQNIQKQDLIYLKEEELQLYQQEDQEIDQINGIEKSNKLCHKQEEKSKKKYYQEYSLQKDNIQMKVNQYKRCTYIDELSKSKNKEKKNTELREFQNAKEESQHKIKINDLSLNDSAKNQSQNSISCSQSDNELDSEFSLDNSELSSEPFKQLGNQQHQQKLDLLQEIKSISVYIQTELCQDTLENYIRERNKKLQTKEKNQESLTQMKKNFMKESIIIIQQIIQTLRHVHQNCSLIHRDLKPSNIFLNEGLFVKLGDFGLAKNYKNFEPVNSSPFLQAQDPQKMKKNSEKFIFQNELIQFQKTNSENQRFLDVKHDDQSNSSQICGTQLYASPEQMKEDCHQLDNHTDIFSLGIIFFELLFPMYTNMEKNLMIENLKIGIFPSQFQQENYQLLKLIKKMMDQNPKKRPEINEISNVISQFEQELNCQSSFTNLGPFLLKFENQVKWSQKYLRIIQNSLYIYLSETDEKAQTMYDLQQCEISHINKKLKRNSPNQAYPELIRIEHPVQYNCLIQIYQHQDHHQLYSNLKINSETINNPIFSHPKTVDHQNFILLKSILLN